MRLPSRAVPVSSAASSARGRNAATVSNTTSTMIASAGESLVSYGADDDTEVVRLRPERPNLQWKDSSFYDQALPALNQMRKNRHFCDVTLQIGKYEIWAHRVVLAAASPYWMELFTSEEDRATRKEVELDGGILYKLDGGFQKDALDRLVEYCYTAKLDIPGDQVKPVYMAAVRLKMDKVAAECARFMISHLDLSSCLDLRSMPGIAPVFKNGKSDVVQHPNGGEASVACLDDDENIDLVSEVDEFIQSNFQHLGDSRELRALPRICLEILHFSKEEREMALARPLCELALDWVKCQWFDDGQLTLDELSARRHLLFMASDNTLQDCREIEGGSRLDSDAVQDYKKQHNLLKKNVRKSRYVAPLVKPAKPREMLYSRYINQDDHAKQADVKDGWKLIACHRLDDQSILAAVTLDRHLATFSIMQRVHMPTSPLSPVSNPGPCLASSNLDVAGPAKSPKLSRPPSIEKEMAYASVAPMGQAKCAVGAACLQGSLVVCGGYDRGECLNTFESYDLKGNKWTTLPAMLAKRGRFDVATVGDSVLYAVGGSNGQTEEQSVERFDAATGTWTQVASLPICLSNIGVCSLDSRIYCVGGTYGSSGTRYSFCLDEEKGEWERIANINTGRLQAAVAEYQGKVWVAGGCDAWNPLRTVEIYDPATNSWKFGPPLSCPRRGCGLAVWKGQLMVVGGFDGTFSLCTTEVFDQAENVWKPGPTMTTCRTNVAVAVAKNRLWAVGGFTGKVFLNTIEYLDPESDEWTTFVTVPEDAGCPCYLRESSAPSSEDEASAITFTAGARRLKGEASEEENGIAEGENFPSDLNNEEVAEQDPSSETCSTGSTQVSEEGTEV